MWKLTKCYTTRQPQQDQPRRKRKSAAERVPLTISLPEEDGDMTGGVRDERPAMRKGTTAGEARSVCSTREKLRVVVVHLRSLQREDNGESVRQQEEQQRGKKDQSRSAQRRKQRDFGQHRGVEDQSRRLHRERLARWSQQRSQQE